MSEVKAAEVSAILKEQLSGFTSDIVYNLFSYLKINDPNVFLNY
jgi:hypothetical protein